MESQLLDLINKKEKCIGSVTKVLELRLVCINDSITKIKNIKSFDKSQLEKEVIQLGSDLSSTFQKINRRQRRAEKFHYIEQCI